MKFPILLPNIFNHPFTYESNLNLKIGDYVVVPFGKSKMTGIVWDEFEKKNNKDFKLKTVLKKLNVTQFKKKTIKDCGHNPLNEYPDITLKFIHDFIINLL